MSNLSIAVLELADQAFYMIIDEQYSTWWTEHLQRPPLPLGYVLRSTMHYKVLRKLPDFRNIT